MTLRLPHILSILAAAAAIVAAVVLAMQYLRSNGDSGRTGVADIGGPFELLDQDGRTRTDADFRGELMLVYFGYTHCPDVCPTALNDIGFALDQLGEAGARVRPIFITLDPARDTPEHLKAYTANFHPRLTGLTGSEAAVAGAAKAYRVYYARSQQGDGEGNYLVDHSSIIFLMGTDGRYITHFSHGTPVGRMAARIRESLP